MYTMIIYFAMITGLIIIFITSSKTKKVNKLNESQDL